MLEESNLETKHHFGKKVKLCMTGLVLTIIVGIGVYFYYNHYYPSTDDAYINANIVYISPQVTGEVTQVLVANHQAVQAGEVLFTIDPAAYTTEVAQTNASLKVAEAELIADQEQVQVNAANLSQAAAELALVQKKSSRILGLLSKGFVSQEQGDQAVADLATAKASLAGDNAAVMQAKQNLIIQQNQIKVAGANLDSAKLNLGYTTVTAPVTGVISDLTLRPGMVVSPDSQLFAIVDQNGFWVDANFEETQLQRIRNGQKVKITLDMYPGVPFKGVIQNISAANGSTFSLLPPENATGNWVKVTQRFPVKVMIPMDALLEKYPLRVGASASVTVDTRSFGS